MSIIREVLVLPLVPVRWIDRVGSLGLAEQLDERGDPVQRRARAGSRASGPAGPARPRRRSRRERRRGCRHRRRESRRSPLPRRDGPELTGSLRGGPAVGFRAMTTEPHPDLSETTAGRGRAVVVPDKPALEGLEATWSQRWKDDDTYALRPDRRPASRSTRSTRRRRPCRGRCTSGTCSPTRTPTWSRASSGCAARRSSTRWAGTTTACRPSAGCRTTSASAATRRCRTTPTSRRPAKPDPKQQIPISRPNFVELCERLVEEDEKVFESLWRTLGLSVDWKQHYTTIGAKSADRVAARVPAQLRPRRGLPAGVADAVGRHLPDRGRAGRARGPRVRRRLPPGRLPRPDGEPRLHRDHPPRADPRGAWR